MDTNQPTTAAATTPAPGIFGTKIPSTVTFAIAVLLFFLPFIDIKCNNLSLQTVSGVQLATGFKMKNNSSGNSFLNDMKTDTVDKTITKATTKTDDKDPNLYAMIALGLGILGLVLSLTNSKAAIGGAMVTGIASAAAMVGLLLDIKKKIKMDIPDTGSGNDLSDDINKIGKTVSDKMNISVEFTPWFYVALIAFLVAAFFCYKRMSAPK